ncbi:MAG: hypothetical protein ACRDXX_05565, partial [Stackebrandtia sp.]
LVAGGLFALARVAGYWLLERTLRRQRRTARLSHLASGVFLLLVGLSWLSNVSFLSNVTGKIGELL